MSIEAMKQALDALNEAVAFREGGRQKAIDAVAALRTALSQQPATGEPVARCLTEDEQLKTTLRDPVIWVRDIPRGQNLYTHPAPSVPDDVVRVPVQVLKDASEALGNFVSDHGWDSDDMQAMDNLDAYIARHEANRAAMLAAKTGGAP